MRAVLVVIANLVEKKSPQMAFVHRNNVIQRLSPTAFDPALRHPVLPWTLERGLHRLNPEGSHGSGKLPSVLPVPVEDQKPRSRRLQARSENGFVPVPIISGYRRGFGTVRLARMEFFGRDNPFGI